MRPLPYITASLETRRPTARAHVPLRIAPKTNVTSAAAWSGKDPGQLFILTINPMLCSQPGQSLYIASIFKCVKKGGHTGVETLRELGGAQISDHLPKFSLRSHSLPSASASTPPHSWLISF